MTETSFVDRHARGLLLRDMTAGFSLAFNPADTSLTATNFQTFLGTVGTLNGDIAGAQGAYKTQSVTRVTLVKTIKTTVTQALARLKSNAVWSSEWVSAKQVADRLRGGRPPKPKAPAEGEPPETEKKRNSGEQAYAEVAGAFEKFIAIVLTAPGYAAGVPAAINAASLAGLLTAIKTQNSALCTLSAAILGNQKKRVKLYFEKGGFQEKFQAVKESVKSQYGQSSAEYQSVKAVKW